MRLNPRGMTKKRLLLLFLQLSVIAEMRAATVSWDGGSNGTGFLWETPTNWAADAIPATGDDVVFSTRNGNVNGLIGDGNAMALNRSFDLNRVTFSDATSRLPALLTINPNSTDQANRTLTLTAGIDVLQSNKAVTFNRLNSFGDTLAIALAGNNTFNVEQAAGSLNLLPVISGNFDITKAGNGTLSLGATNTYTGSTIVNGGTLALGASDVLPDTSAVVLDGGTLSTSGLTDTTGTLQLLSASTINNGANLAFANSSSIGWTGILSIWNWTTGTIRFGNSNLGLTSTQLSNIVAYSGAGTGTVTQVTLDANGFLVAVPEPGAVLAGMLLLGGIGWRERRHFLRQRTLA